MSDAVSKTTADRRQYRVNHGLCPVCGKEAAPYYLCEYHRQIGGLGRMMDLMAKRGIVQKHRDGRYVAYSIPPGDTPKVEEFSWLPRMGGCRPGDKRFRPRMGRRPVDLDETLREIFREAGKPLTMEEIYAAWGALRSKRKTGSLAGDMITIVNAQRRRQERYAKRLTRLVAE